MDYIKKERRLMSEIKIEGLCKKIKGAVILDHISMTLTSGKIYGFKGKNGSGKTMLMRAVSGLLIPDEGTVVINGKTLHKDIPFPESIGILIENPSFLSQYTGYKNLKMLSGLTGHIADEDIKLALIRVGLDPSDKRVFRKYSLGMKEKLGIANAIMGEPDIIILDEPINALDEESVRKIKDILLEIRDKGKLIIIACHDREELEFLSDVIFEIQDGRVVDRKEISNEDI